MRRRFLGFLVLTSSFIALPIWATTTNITQINFTTPPQTININTISGILTVQTQNVGGTEEKLDTSGTVLELSSSSGTGEFSTSNTTWNSVTTLGMNNGWANRNFYYRDSTPGSHTLTISAQNQPWTPATQTITVNAPAITLIGIAITALPTKTTYTVGEVFDITGLVVVGTYSDNSTTSEQIGYSDVTGFDSSVPVTGQILTVTVGGQTATFTVDIISAPVVNSIEPIIDPTPPSRSGGYVLGWNQGRVLGASTSRIQESVEQHRLKIIERKLRFIKRRLILIKHPELAEAAEVVDDEIMNREINKIVDLTSSTIATSTTKKKWWQILW